jgi:5-methylcytosine-specific restriction endonuclease McrA
MKLTYRDLFFIEHGWGPYYCWDCDECVTLENLHIHHLDHDHSNKDPENLVPMHISCHARCHAKEISAEKRHSRAVKGGAAQFDAR